MVVARGLAFAAVAIMETEPPSEIFSTVPSTRLLSLEPSKSRAPVPRFQNVPAAVVTRLVAGVSMAAFRVELPWLVIVPNETATPALPVTSSWAAACIVRSPNRAPADELMAEVMPALTVTSLSERSMMSP